MIKELFINLNKTIRISLLIVISNLYLLSHAQVTTLHKKMKTGSMSKVKYWIKSTSNIDKKDVLKNSALHYAALHNRDSVITLLLANKANVNIKNKLHDTPLLFASKNGSLSTVEILINNGANIKLKNKIGETALHLYARLGNKEIVKLLINKGADVNALTNTNCSPLHYGMFNNDTTIGNYLLKYGADFTVEKLFENDSLGYKDAPHQFAAANIFHLYADNRMESGYDSTCLDYYLDAATLYRKSSEHFLFLSKKANVKRNLKSFVSILSYAGYITASVYKVPSVWVIDRRFQKYVTESNFYLNQSVLSQHYAKRCSLLVDCYNSNYNSKTGDLCSLKFPRDYFTQDTVIEQRN